MAGYNPSTASNGFKHLDDIKGIYPFENMSGGTFWPQTASQPQYLSSGAGNVPSEWSVAHTATGKFVVTLSPGALGLGVRSTAKLEDIRVSLQLGTASDKIVSVSNFNAAAGTFEIDVVTGTTGALVDIAANASNSISWHLRLCLGGPASISNI